MSPGKRHIGGGLGIISTPIEFYSPELNTKQSLYPTSELPSWSGLSSSLVYGIANVIKYYGIPWLAVTHWFIMIS